MEPPLAHGAKGGAHAPLGRICPLPFGLVPHGKLREVCPLLGLHKEGRGALFFITLILRQVSLISLFLLSPSSSGLPLFGVYTWLGISPSYARRRVAGIGI